MSSFDLRHLVIALQRQLQVKSQQLQEAQAELQVSSGPLRTSAGMICCVCSSQLQASATQCCNTVLRSLCTAKSGLQKLTDLGSPLSHLSCIFQPTTSCT